MRMKSARSRLACLLAAFLLAPWPFAAAQDGQILMPEQSAAKAKQLLQQTIEAMGGDAFLNIRDMTCTGRYSQFGHSGEMEGFEKFPRLLRAAKHVADRKFAAAQHHRSL